MENFLVCREVLGSSAGASKDTKCCISTKKHTPFAQLHRVVIVRSRSALTELVEVLQIGASRDAMHFVSTIDNQNLNILSKQPI